VRDNYSAASKQIHYQQLNEQPVEGLPVTPMAEYRRVDINDATNGDAYVYSERFYAPTEDSGSPFIVLAREDVFDNPGEHLLPDGKLPMREYLA
jgi:hypothetical protein